MYVIYRVNVKSGEIEHVTQTPSGLKAKALVNAGNEMLRKLKFFDFIYRSTWAYTSL